MQRKRMIWFLAGMLILALALPAAGVEAQARPRGIYLALGDSLSVGVGATNPAQLGYVPRLFNYFRGTAHAGVDTLVNVGSGAETSTTLINGGQLASALAAINDPTTDIRVLTLDIGGNDLLALLHPDSPSQCLQDPTGSTCQLALAAALTTFTGNYVAILTQLTAALAADPGDEVVMVMTYYNHLSGTGHPFEPILTAALLGLDQMMSCAAPQSTWGINEIILCIGSTFGVRVVDVYPPFVGKSRTLTHVEEGLDFHPTNAGYAIIANTFMRASH